MRLNKGLWVAQGMLAALFLFAGVSKLMLPIEAMAGPVAFPGWFLRFIGVVETLGAVGLILPWLFKIRPELTPLAASGLVIIMLGATVVTLIGGMGPAAAIPFVDRRARGVGGLRPGPADACRVLNAELAEHAESSVGCPLRAPRPLRSVHRVRGYARRQKTINAELAETAESESFVSFVSSVLSTRHGSAHASGCRRLLARRPP